MLDPWAWTSAIVSDTTSWLRLAPLIGTRLASTARSPTSSGPLDPNYGGETGLQRLLPLNTHRFFQTLWRQRGSLAYWEERGGFKTLISPKTSLFFSFYG